MNIWRLFITNSSRELWREIINFFYFLFPKMIYFVLETKKMLLDSNVKLFRECLQLKGTLDPDDFLRHKTLTWTWH